MLSDGHADHHLVPLTDADHGSRAAGCLRLSRDIGPWRPCMHGLPPWGDRSFQGRPPAAASEQ